MSTEEENEISTLLTASIDLNSKSEKISPEDAAWVDSCLVFDHQMFDDSWDMLIKVLLQTYTAQVKSDYKQSSNAQLSEIAQRSEEEKEE